MKLIIAAIVATGLIGAGVLIFSNDSAEAPTPQTQTASQPANTTNNEQASQDEAKSEFKITYSDSGFEPQSLTVPLGSVINVQNDSSSALQFSSDPHPAHTDNPELNAVNLEPGGSTTVTVNTNGTWGIHNHLNHSHAATLTVE